MKNIFAFIAALSVLTASSQVDISPRVEDALSKGDAAAISILCMPQVDLSLNGQDETYPQSEVKAILGKFFLTNTPKSFVIKHRGTSKLDDQYCIGELVTSRQTYRVTFFMKKSGNTMMIQQLKIESPNDDF